MFASLLDIARSLVGRRPPKWPASCCIWRWRFMGPQGVVLHRVRRHLAFSIPPRLVPRERTGIGESKEATDPFHDVQWNFADMLSLS